MPTARLRETLEALERELERTRELDAASREQLERVVEEAREVLERTGGDEGGSLLHRLREATRDFEEEHPALAETIGRVAAALSNLGI